MEFQPQVASATTSGASLTSLSQLTARTQTQMPHALSDKKMVGNTVAPTISCPQQKDGGRKLPSSCRAATEPW